MQEVDAQNVSDAMLKKADGLVVRVRWKTIEPKNNQFKLDFLKAQIARCKRLGKLMHLQVLGGDESPTWLKSLGAKYGSGLPLPWDAVYQAEYSAMISHLRANLDWTPITHYHIPGADNSEWFFKEYGVYSHPDYTDAKMVKAHVDWVQMLAGKIPGVIITCDIADHDKKWTETAIKEMKAKFKGRVGFQMDSLSAKTSTSYKGYTRIRDAAAEGHHAGFELLGPSKGANGKPVERFGGTYASAMKKADATKAQWECPYQWDL